MKKTILASLLILTGCGTLPRDAVDANSHIPKEVTKIEMPPTRYADVPEPVSEINQSLISKSLTIAPLDFSEPLPDFQIRNLSLSDASISDALTLINTVRPISFTVDRTIDGQLAQGSTFSADNLTGSFKDVLNSLSNSMGFFYSYRNNTLFVQPDQQFILTIPPVLDLLDSSANTITNLGGRNVNLNKPSGTISFTATKSAYNAINNYIRYIKETRSVVSYDTWIYEVTLNDTKEAGIQWNKFGFTSGENSAGLTGTAATQAASPLGLSLIFGAGKFNMDVLVQFLQTQGNLKTLSQPKIAVLSGGKGTIKAGRKITYVSQVGQSTVGTTLTSSATTATLQLGTDLTLTADVDDGTVYTKIDLKVDDLNQLSVNNILGSQITLPDTITREINTTVRARPGDVILLGGVSTTRDVDNGDGIPLGKNALTTRTNTQSQRSELVIILKPQIIKFKGL